MSDKMLRYSIPFALLFFLVACQYPCSEWIKADDDLTYKSLQKAISEKVQIPIKSCIEEVIRRNFEKSGELLMENFSVTDFEEAATAAISNVRNSIDKWTNTLKSKQRKTKKVRLVAPAFQWAQSLNNVYLNVKYSPKLDSPGYLEVKNETVDFTEQGLVLSAEVEREDSILKFELNLELFDEIVPENSTWSHEAVGRAYISLEKKNKEKWKRLLKGEEKPANMHFWWSMQEKYRGEISDDDDDD